MHHENIEYGTQNKIRTEVVYTCVNMGWLGGGGGGERMGFHEIKALDRLLFSNYGSKEIPGKKR